MVTSWHGSFALVYSLPVAIPIHFSITGESQVNCPSSYPWTRAPHSRPPDLGNGKVGGCGGVTSAAGDCGLWTLRGFQRLQLLHSCRKNPLRKGHCAGELVGGSASRMDAGATPAKRREEGPRATNIKGQGSHCVSSRCSEKALGFHHCLPAISVKR